MKYRSQSQLPAKLADGRQQFERWRSQHKPYTHIPEPLWSLATKLAREFGLNRTASMMRLDYYGPKKRLERPVVDDTSPATAGPSFLELLPVQATPAVERILFPGQISTNSGFVKYLKIGSQQCCQFLFTFGGSVVKDARNRGAD